MRVIICGAGRVGKGIAERLASENNAVTVIDVSSELIRNITTDLDVRGIVGHGAYPDVLKRAGIDATDMLIAVTHSDEVNMIACQVAHSLFDVPTKIARVRAQAYLENEWSNLFSSDNLPIDIVISPEIEIGKSILRRLTTPGASDVVPFMDGRVKLLGIPIQEDCPIVAMPVRQIPDLFANLQAEIVGVQRDGQMFAIDGDDSLYVGDEAYFVVQSSHVSRLLEIMSASEQRARHIVIIGGGNVGTYVAAQLETISGMRTRIIEIDKKRAENDARELKRTVILNGNGMSTELQLEAGISDSEVVLCLTDDDETNLLSGVLGKKLGAKEAICLVNDMSMQGLKSELPIDTIIDPRATTVSSILRHVRRGRIVDVYELGDGQAEVMEGEVLDTSPLAGKRLEEFSVMDGVAIGAVLHNGQVLSPDPQLIIKAGDRIVLLAEHDSLKEVEQIFRVSMDYF